MVRLNNFQEQISFYDSCQSQFEDDITAQIQCISDLSQEKTNDISIGIDTFFLLFGSSLMFFMQAGFAMLCAGSVRLKNVQNTMLKNLLDACGAALGFWSFGFAFAYGGTNEFTRDPQEEIEDGVTTFIGDGHFFLQGFENYSIWLFQFAFAATSATIVAGSLAERSQMRAYLCYSFMLTGFVYPVVVHTFWSVEGFLSPFNPNPFLGIGAMDFAGAGVVHMTGGMTALIAVMILGPRKGRFTDERTGEPIERPKRMKGHSMSLQVLGTFILWFGWYGFNVGSTYTISSAKSATIASLAGVCTTLAGSAGCVTALCFSTFKTEKITGETTFELVYALNGCLSGLVSITGACGLVEPWAAVVIGFVSGFIYFYSSELLVKFRLDDAVDAIPVHLFNGLWGMLCIGFFASPSRVEQVYGVEVSGLFYYDGASYDGSLLAVQFIGILFILGWVMVLMTPFFLILSYVGWLRADPLEEIVGLDISYHGRSAYNMEWGRYEDGEAPAQEHKSNGGDTVGMSGTMGMSGDVVVSLDEEEIEDVWDE
eukprot:CAMPEP_0116063070 /NCGR_PEP_ID=MMETSP0322-20121206/8183_1 /TAXON_ID=163516 /ORGANISM="Leptocylindrus danicus var. apora, Strain B651" /LENGTH=539 /DNA_ID=CAMNT_0003548593 /DNA_START=48 /DNA_END=1667 /DNA_ORIENTATION=+